MINKRGRKPQNYYSELNEAPKEKILRQTTNINKVTKRIQKLNRDKLSDKINNAPNLTTEKNKLENDIMGFLNNEDLSSLVKFCETKKYNYNEYNYLKYKEIVYKKHDTVFIQNASDPEKDYIGKIKKIIRIDGAKTYCFVKLQWFYRKSELQLDKKQNLQYLSDQEVFLTVHYDIQSVEAINGHCQIISFEEFDIMESGLSHGTFFTRASYNIFNKKLTPPIEQWPTECICRQPVNPDKEYIQCENCQNWYHIQCVNIPEQQVDKIEGYKCGFCK